MKILAISGSPRKGGNTDTLLRIALDVLEYHSIETDFISLSGKKILTCTACMACKQEPRCVLEDDFDHIFRTMVDSDGFIIGSPVYFGSATALLKALMERTGYISGRRRVFAGKVGGPLVVARRAGQNFTFAQLMYWFYILGFFIPGSTYWNIAFGREKGEVKNDEEGLATAWNFGKNVALLVKKLKT